MPYQTFIIHLLHCRFLTLQLKKRMFTVNKLCIFLVAQNAVKHIAASMKGRCSNPFIQQWPWSDF